MLRNHRLESIRSGATRRHGHLDGEVGRNGGLSTAAVEMVKISERGKVWLWSSAVKCALGVSLFSVCRQTDAFSGIIDICNLIALFAWLPLATRSHRLSSHRLCEILASFLFYYNTDRAFAVFSKTRIQLHLVGLAPMNEGEKYLLRITCRYFHIIS